MTVCERWDLLPVSERLTVLERLDSSRHHIAHGELLEAVAVRPFGQLDSELQDQVSLSLTKTQAAVSH